MSSAKVCDMCGAVIERRNDPLPMARYLITIQRVRLFKPETITVDLCPNCFNAICEVSRKKNERKEQDNECK